MPTVHYPPERVSCGSPTQMENAAENGALLEALPGPAWIVDYASLSVLQRNAAAAAITTDSDFTAVFPAGLDPGLVERLRSTQPKFSFHAVTRAEFGKGLFSTTLLPDSNPPKRLILAQPVAIFDVPTQLTFDEILDSAFDALAILDAERRFVQVSQRFHQMFGYTIEDLRGKTPGELVPPNLSYEFSSGNELLDRGGIHRLETQRMRRDGRLVEVEVSSQPIPSGRYIGGFVVVYRDLTEVSRTTRRRNLRLEATRTLATASTLEQAAHELLPAISRALKWEVVRLWKVGSNGLECVDGFSASGQYCNRDFAGSRGRCTLRAEQVAHDGVPVWELEFRALDSCRGNSCCRLGEGSLAALPIVDTHKQVLGVLELLSSERLEPEPGQRELLEGICLHLGEFITRCNAEAALAENEAKFRTLAEMAPTAIFIHVGGVALYANTAFETITGYSRAEILNRPLWPLFHPDDVPELQERARRRQHGDGAQELRGNWECRVACKDGGVRWINYAAARITLDHQPAVLCAAVDVTERRELEQQLRQTQKMEAIGRLAGGIAHDFNNMLMVIGCSSALILMNDDLNAEVRRSAEEISNAADRAAALTQQLLTFSRHQVLEPRVLDLNAVLAGTELILRRALGDDIELRFDFEPELGMIMADRSQIEQVAMNLAVNARDAMPDGGELHISTCHVSLDVSVPRAGEYAVLTVKDTGIGMNQEVQQHIFEPFFTTKSANKGTGLGLSTVYGIAKQCGGFVAVDSQPNRGTTFKVYFPIAAGIIESARTEETYERTAAQKAVVLLVEDQEDVRDVLNVSLVRDGYTVLQASNGAQALQVSAEYPGHIDLLLTDIVMSGISGREVADRLTAAHPDLKVLFVSGYNEDTVLHNGVVNGEAEFLQKPFPPSVLSRKVRQVLSK